MPKNDAIPEGRSQSLTFASGDMVTLDRKTCHELNKLIGQSIDQLQHIRHCEIMLTSLESHLYGLADREPDKSFEITKGLLLLKHWLDCVPESQTQIDGRLQKAFQTLKVILAASELGGGNE